MAGTTSKTFVITQANGRDVEVSGTHVDTDNTTVSVYNGEEIVASFRGYQAFYPKG